MSQIFKRRVVGLRDIRLRIDPVDLDTSVMNDVWVRRSLSFFRRRLHRVLEPFRSNFHGRQRLVKGGGWAVQPHSTRDNRRIGVLYLRPRIGGNKPLRTVNRVRWLSATQG